MDTSKTTSSESLVKLTEQLGRLGGGSSSIGDFITWFRSASWEAANAGDASLLRLGWAIDNILFEYEDFPDDITPEDVVEQLDQLVHDAWSRFKGNMSTESIDNDLASVPSSGRLNRH